MNRREAIIALVAIGAVPLGAEARQAVKVHRIGLLEHWPLVPARQTEVH